jgi:predicted tellurium resistance membrane protein TerC
MFDWVSDPGAWVALASLAAIEIVLGIDNVVFISILVARLPPEQREFARIAGLGLAMATRIALLFAIAWIIGLSDPLFEVLGREITGRALILFGGGLFLLWKSVHEIHRSLEGEEGVPTARPARAVLWVVLAQIAVLDVVFSLDSVITAVGLVDELPVMVAAIVIAVGVMMFAARPLGKFVDRHPTVKMLALSFLVLIGFTLIAESAGIHVPKGYVYFAMAFSIAVELLNLRMRRRTLPAPAAVQLRRRRAAEEAGAADPAPAKPVERAWLLDPDRLLGRFRRRRRPAG